MDGEGSGTQGSGGVQRQKNNKQPRHRGGGKSPSTGGGRRRRRLNTLVVKYALVVGCFVSIFQCIRFEVKQQTNISFEVSFGSSPLSSWFGLPTNTVSNSNVTDTSDTTSTNTGKGGKYITFNGIPVDAGDKDGVNRKFDSGGSVIQSSLLSFKEEKTTKMGNSDNGASSETAIMQTPSTIHDDNGINNHHQQQQHHQQQHDRTYKTATSTTPSTLIDDDPTATTSCIDTTDDNNPITYTFPKHVPTFIIAGQHKCGTTALYYILKNHPNLLSSKQLEPHYFDNRSDKLYRQLKLKSKPNSTTRKNIICNNQYYYAQNNFDMKLRNHTIRHLLKLAANTTSSNGGGGSATPTTSTILGTFEKTPSYLSYWKVPYIIKRILPWTKIVVSLRNPMDRLMGEIKTKMYQYNISKLDIATNNTVAFDTYIASDLRTQMELIKNTSTYSKAFETRYLVRHGVPRGVYVEQLKPWLVYYTLGVDLMIFPYEEFKEDPQQVLDEIANFVGIPKHEYSHDLLFADLSPEIQTSNERRKQGKSFASRTTSASSILPRYFETELYEFYKPYNDMLLDLFLHNGDKNDTTTTTTTTSTSRSSSTASRFRGIWDK